MSHELRKAMLTALSVAVIGGFFNTFGDYQQLRISVPSFTNTWQIYNVPLDGQSEPFKLTRSSAAFKDLSRAAVILVEFSDEKITTTPEQWRRLVFNGETPSVNQFYKDSSQGKFQIIPILEHSGLANDGVIQVTLDRKHPNNGNALTPETYEAIDMAIEGAAAYLSLEGLDVNQDTILQPEEVIWIVVFAGFEDLYKKSGENSSSGFSHELRSYGRIQGYQMTEFVQIGELYYEDPWLKESGITTHGILTHEIGHILGLPDLYDTDYSSQGVGLFSLMGNGDKLFYRNGKMGEAPSDLDPWSKIYLGFVEPMIVNVSGEYNLQSNKGENPQVLIIPTEISGEYFILENRYFENQDEGLGLFSKSGGVLIWHVDETLIFRRIDQNIVNDDESQKAIDLEESSEEFLGYRELDQQPSDDVQDLFYRKEGVSLFNGESRPSSNLNNGNASGIEVEILEDGDEAKIRVLLKK